MSKELRPLRKLGRKSNNICIKLSKTTTDKKAISLPPELIQLLQKNRLGKIGARTVVKSRYF